MRRLLILLTGLSLTALAPSHLCAAEQTPPQAGSEGSPVTVVGEVAMRPEFQVFEGVRGWLVNGQEIPLAAVRDHAILYHGPYILQDLVCETLLEQEAKRRGVTVTDQEIDAQIKQLRTEMGLVSDAALDFYLRRTRVTPGWLRDKARDYVLVEKVLGDQVYVSDKEVERFYEQFREQYRRPEAVAFRIVSLPSEKDAQAALTQLRSGRKFQEVAKEIASPEEKPVAGELLSYERGQPSSIPAEIEAVLFTAPLDQVVGPIKSGNAYYLIRVEKKVDAYQFSLAEVKDTIRTQLRKRKLEQAVWPQWIRAQLGGAEIEVLKAD